MLTKVSKKMKEKIKFYINHGCEHKFHEMKVVDLETAKRKYSIDMVGKFLPKNKREGYSAELVFFNFESQGLIIPCKLNELDKLFDIFHGMKMADITIKLIAEDIVDRLFFFDDMLYYVDHPKWFKTAFINLARKLGATPSKMDKFEKLADIENLDEEKRNLKI